MILVRFIATTLCKVLKLGKQLTNTIILLILIADTRIGSAGHGITSEIMVDIKQVYVHGNRKWEGGFNTCLVLLSVW